MNNGGSSKFSILGVRISAIDMQDATSFIEEVILKGWEKYICVCPVSTIMSCNRDSETLNCINSADLVTPDGMPVVWLGRSFGFTRVRRVYGPDLMRKICEISVKKGYSHYFYGSKQEVLDSLREELCKSYPGLRINGMFSPPFRQLTKEEDDKIVDEINRSHSDIVWVGLGSPKQDLWMYEHRGRINAPVMVGVGAAFDFLSGAKPQAPVWIRSIGLEWLFRLISEPKRLWRRYLIDNTLFVYFVIIDLLRRRTKSC